MRKIKFRAWDTEKKKFYLDYEVRILGNGSIWTDNQWNESILHNHGGIGHKIVIQQFTGFLDKNGKEIYEGDIIRYIGTLGNKNIIAVVFEEGSFVADGILLVTYVEPTLDKRDSAEVIGNIYENPNLLQ